MTTYFVSRHPGAVEWAAKRGIDAELVEHLDTGEIDAGDVVIGTLPVHLVAKINARGGRYLHLTMDVPLEMRGEDLSAEQMDLHGAKMQEFHVKTVSEKID
jgi:CRISPR-associated protein Csx16